MNTAALIRRHRRAGKIAPVARRPSVIKPWPAGTTPGDRPALLARIVRAVLDLHAKNIKQTVIARTVGISQATVSRILAGQWQELVQED